MKERKLLIGIDDATRCNVMGSLTLAMVVVQEPNFWRNFARLPIRDSKLLTRKQRDEVVARTRGHVWFDVFYIKPQEMTENLNILETKAIVELLNRYPKFWEHIVHIDNFEKDKEKFIERFESVLPHKLIEIKNKFPYDKWKIEHHADENYKIVSLASIYAKNASDLEYDEIRSVWGDFGSGSPSDPKTIEFILRNEDCPHIRNTWITVKRLKDPVFKEKVLALVTKGCTSKELGELYKAEDVSNDN
jgi:ribonuclease HII